MTAFFNKPSWIEASSSLSKTHLYFWLQSISRWRENEYQHITISNLFLERTPEIQGVQTLNYSLMLTNILSPAWALCLHGWIIPHGPPGVKLKLWVLVGKFIKWNRILQTREREREIQGPNTFNNIKTPHSCIFRLWQRVKKAWQISAYFLYNMKDTDANTLFMYFKNIIDKTVSRMGIKEIEVN